MESITKQIFWGLLLALGAAWTGHHVHKQTDCSPVWAADEVPSIGYLAGPESFSKVQNTRNSLEALCLRLRLEAQTKLIALTRTPSSVQQRKSLQQVTVELEGEMNEFSGTEQEVELAQDLLVAYKCADHFDHWVDLYLKLAYGHPMHPVPLRLAADALALGQAIGRQEEVLKALEHVNAIPLDFEGKRQLAAVLSKVGLRDQLTHFEGVPRQTQGGS